ncbi:MAG: TolC family protein [Bacteroidales bacterium]|jgi:outer membrane protein TolC|nr:TolC family protein [Bacteroidales bacterium]
MKNGIYLLMTALLLYLQESAVAQKIALEECITKAKAHFPMNEKNIRIIEELTLNTIRTIQTEWSPKVEVIGQASYQSDVPRIELPASLPFTFPIAPKDQYKIGVEVVQMLYDAGAIKANQQIQRTQSAVEVQNTKLKINEIAITVAELYFTVLILDGQKEQLQAMASDLNARIDELQTAVRHGVAQLSDRQTLEVELLRLDKQFISMEEQRNALIMSLSVYTGMEIDREVILEAPPDDLPVIPQPRPEFELFRLQHVHFDAMIAADRYGKAPVILAFGQAGYANPGFNMLSDKFDWYYAFGLRLRWTPFDWKNTSRRSASLQLQKNLVETQREYFRMELKNKDAELSAELARYRRNAEKDREIIALQQQITENYRAKLKNGSVTSSDYVTALNNEYRSRMEESINRLKYRKTLVMKSLAVGEITDDAAIVNFK